MAPGFLELAHANIICRLEPNRQVDNPLFDSYNNESMYDLNYAIMEKVAPHVWRKAMNNASWIRFVTARHPLARLYSGWNSNLHRTSPMAPRLIRQMQLNTFIKDAEPNHVISWGNFLQFFRHAIRHNQRLIEGHFVPIYNKCGLCLR